MLQTGIFGPIAIHSQDKNELTDDLLEEFGKIWKLNSDLFSKDVKVLSIPFAEALLQSVDKLSSGDLLDKAFLQNTSGTIIISDRTMCYTFERINEKQTNLTYYFFQKNSTESPELRCFIYLEFNGQDSSTNIQTYISKSGIYNDNINFSTELYIRILIATLNFIKFADIEVKILPPNKRIKDIDCKYVNDTSSNIKYLNSTWFTTLIKSDNFKVRGHFKLQPKKVNGEWTKQIIWVNEFEKTGYTSIAKKMNE